MTDSQDQFRPEQRAAQPGQPRSAQAQSAQPQSDQGQHGPRHAQPQSDQPQQGQPQYTQPQYTQPQYGQPQYGQPQYGQPQYGQPQYTQPQYTQPQYGQPQYGQGPYGQAHPEQPLWEAAPGAAPKPASRRRAGIVAVAAVAVVVAGGVSYAALRDKNGSTGASSPQGAVKSIVTDLGKSDILGMLDDLPPAERTAVRDSFTNEVKQLKRLKVLDPAADPGKVAGVQFAATGLTYDKSDEVINDHVRIVKITGGVVTVNSDAARVPFTKEFLDAAFDGKPPTDKQSDTYDLSKNKPARIAVQKVNGKWYPSFLYTALDSSTKDDGLANPTSNDAVPAVGAQSADDAVRQMVTAVLENDYNSAIAVMDPQEAAAFHDYGKLLTHSTSPKSAAVDIGNITFADTAVAGGTRVSVKSVKFTQDGKTTTVTIDGGCVRVESGGKNERMCALDVLARLGSVHLTEQQRAAVNDLVAALPKIGLIASKSGGKWFISPVRSYADIDLVVLSNLKDNDVLILIRLARSR